MTQYFVDLSSTLVKEIQEGGWGCRKVGWSLLGRAIGLPKGKYTERWIVEDDNAPAEFEGHLVEPVMQQTLVETSDPAKPEIHISIMSREIRTVSGLD